MKIISLLILLILAAPVSNAGGGYMMIGYGPHARQLAEKDQFAHAMWMRVGDPVQAPLKAVGPAMASVLVAWMVTLPALACMSPSGHTAAALLRASRQLLDSTMPHRAARTMRASAFLPFSAPPTPCATAITLLS